MCGVVWLGTCLLEYMSQIISLLLHNTQTLYWYNIVRGDVKIFDFGLARTMPEDDQPYAHTYRMSGAGTPRYMAPECLNHEPYNLKADVYSFAIILWEMLAGQTPVSAPKPSLLRHKIYSFSLRTFCSPLHTCVLSHKWMCSTHLCGNHNNLFIMLSMKMAALTLTWVGQVPSNLFWNAASMATWITGR